MSTKEDLDNGQYRKGNNRYRLVTLKGIDTQVFEAASLLEYDPTDDTYIAYTGGVITDTVRAILNLDEQFTLSGTSTTVSACIGGDVFEDKLSYPGAFGIDSRPNGSPLSIREQFREVGILAFNSASLTEDHIT